MSLSMTMAANRRSVAMPGVGDPGLFGFLGKVGSTITGVASKVLPGPLGAAAGAVNKLISPATGRPLTATQMRYLEQGRPVPGLTAAQTRQMLGNLPQVPTPGVVGAMQRFLPGGETGMEPAIPPAGYHVNKTGYFLKDGTYVAPGSRYVRNRRRNPLNPRAASRAISRLESAKKATKRLNRITIRKSCPA